jgi:hypothetical protein
MTTKKVVIWDDDCDYDMQSIDLEADCDESHTISKKCCVSSVKSVCSLTSVGYLVLVASLFGVFLRAECEILRTVLGHWILLIVTVPLISGVMRWVRLSCEESNNVENVLVGHDYLGSSMSLGRDVAFISECELLEQISSHSEKKKGPSTVVVQVY